MKFLSRLFSGGAGPTEKQVRRAMKQATQIHGEAAARVAAMERLAGWKTPEAASALLRRFTIQTPQASMDLEEKQYTVRLLVEMGMVVSDPILKFIRSEPDVTFPVQALGRILSPEEFRKRLLDLLAGFSSGYTRWPQVKTVLIANLPEEAFAEVSDTVARFLKDEDDDVCIAAIDYLAAGEDESMRETLLELFFDSEDRPRVRGRILAHFQEKEWPVKGYRKRMEEAIELPFYLTSRGVIKRKTGEP
ncbi:MAG: HEAT repeat domain-containing protein [Acidobacteria bacterium]|nr:HEAT repeat domain-containing protein [Acidobacteriota bacterium]